MKISISMNASSLRLMAKKYQDNDWVILREGAALRFVKNPSSNKAPATEVNKLAENEEIMRVRVARKMGKL